MRRKQSIETKFRAMSWNGLPYGITWLCAVLGVSKGQEILAASKAREGPKRRRFCFNKLEFTDRYAKHYVA
jgi:hypothetical protein